MSHEHTNTQKRVVIFMYLLLKLLTPYGLGKVGSRASQNVSPCYPLPQQRPATLPPLRFAAPQLQDDDGSRRRRKAGKSYSSNAGSVDTDGILWSVYVLVTCVCVFLILFF